MVCPPSPKPGVTPPKKNGETEGRRKGETNAKIHRKRRVKFGANDWRSLFREAARSAHGLRVRSFPFWTLTSEASSALNLRGIDVAHRLVSEVQSELNWSPSSPVAMNIKPGWERQLEIKQSNPLDKSTSCLTKSTRSPPPSSPAKAESMSITIVFLALSPNSPLNSNTIPTI